MKPRMLIMAKAFPPNLGGVETYSQQVALAYHQLGWQVTVVTQHDGPRGWTHQQGVSVLNVGAGPQAVVAARMYAAVRKLSRQHRFEAVHATTWRVALPAIAARGNSRLFITVHGREVAVTTGALRQLMNRVFRRADRVLVISQTSFDICSQVLPCLHGRSVVSWNGISFREEALRMAVDPSTAPPREVQLLACCRLVERKNVATILKALAALGDSGQTNLRLRIAGDGPERARLEQMTDELGLRPRVEFLGHVPAVEVPSLYRQCDVLVHPQSHSHDPRDFESFCLSVVDAMSFGVPVIAGRDGAPSEYIVDDESGLLVDGAQVQSVARAIQRLAENESLRTTIANHGREWALRNLSWERHVSRLIEAERTVFAA